MDGKQTHPLKHWQTRPSNFLKIWTNKDGQFLNTFTFCLCDIKFSYQIQDTGGIVGPAVGNSPWPWGKQDTTFQAPSGLMASSSWDVFFSPVTCLSKRWLIKKYTPEVEHKPWKIMVSNRNLLFQGSTFRCHVSFFGSTSIIGWWNRLFSLKTLGTLILKLYASLFNSSQLH